MKIISVLGGGGSTFVLTSLDKLNYSPVFGKYDPYHLKLRLEKYPLLINLYHAILTTAGGYQPKLKVLKRPDSFWTDWQFNPSGTYNPQSSDFQEDLHRQRDYLIQMRHKRSARLKLSKSDISTGSMTELVGSYIHSIQAIESRNNFQAVLISNHWGGYGIYKELGVETIYLIRDPFNSLISHSKGIRHQKDYIKRGLTHINTRAWIDCYLLGPMHYWINHAESALSHKNATIVRYNHFSEDWKKVKGLPDISADFSNKENNIRESLTQESINYIYNKTADLCMQLGINPEKYL